MEYEIGDRVLLSNNCGCPSNEVVEIIDKDRWDIIYEVIKLSDNLIYHINKNCIVGKVDPNSNKLIPT